MLYALRLWAASMMFGGMLVWWALTAVVAMAAWLAIGGGLALGSHAWRHRAWFRRHAAGKGTPC